MHSSHLARFWSIEDYSEDLEGHTRDLLSGHVLDGIDHAWHNQSLWIGKFGARGLLEGEDPDVQQSVVDHLELAGVALQDVLETRSLVPTCRDPTFPRSSGTFLGPAAHGTDSRLRCSQTGLWCSS